MLAAVVLSLPAAAFAPSDAVLQGVEPQRREPYHAGEQARLTRGSAAFAAFRARVGGEWTVRWDEATRTPREVYGTGIPVDTSSEAALLADVTAQLVADAALFGFDPAQLRTRSVARHEPSDTWYLDFDVEREPGVPTYRGGLSVRVKHGSLILVRALTAPDAPITGSWNVDEAKAAAMAVSQGPAPTAVHTDGTTRRVLLEQWTPDGLVLRRAIEAHSRTATPPGAWVSFVDAETGVLLSVHNEVRFLTGTVTGRHHERSPLGALVSDAMPLVRVQGSSSTYADEDGVYTLASGPFTSTLDGDYLSVDNAAGSNGAVRSNAADFEWTSSSATQAEIDTYVFAHQARDWALGVDSTSGMATRSQQAYVNLNQVCNAYFDGRAINFFREGAGCTNTGENADVVHHEWGHGFHLYQIRSGTFDGSLSEGAADSVAFFQSGSNYIGPGFFSNGGAIRDVSPNRVYPQDVVGEVHEDGLIFAGSIWDMWDMLVQTEGPSQGTEDAEDIFAGLLRGGPTIPQSFAEALVADDDDGNLGNGTPHACQIVAGFAPHGLAQGAVDATLTITATHEIVPFATPGEKTAVKFELPPANDCFSGIASEAVLRYRVNGGDWESAPARANDGTVRGDLPAFEEGDFVEYWMEGEDIDGNTFQSPGSGRVAPYTLYVGDVLEVSCERFGSDGDGGFNGKVMDGIVANPWDFMAPRGSDGDPSSAFSGAKVWGTALGDAGTYPANAKVRLRSPDLSTSHFEGVFLQYRRWLGVEDKQYDQAWIEVNGEPVWSSGGTPEGTGHTRDDEWISHSVDLRGVADRGTATIDFLLESDAGEEYGGWTIDDLCLLAPNTPDNRLGIDDLTVEESDGVAVLSWTNPKFGPVERVVLVKRADRFPEAWDDGEVVADLTGPELGSAAHAADFRLAVDNFYAVYATDGVDWSSFTIEGLNAVEHARESRLAGAEGFLPGGTTEGSSSGCTCDAGAGGVGGASVGVLAAALLIRRRRAR